MLLVFQQLFDCPRKIHSFHLCFAMRQGLVPKPDKSGIVMGVHMTISLADRHCDATDWASHMVTRTF